MNNPDRIASFSVDHDFIDEGIYVSRIDGDIVTYDLRTRKPNAGDYMDNLTMHSVEHMIATFIRGGAIGADVIYFGPMGCQTGFYLLVRNRTNEEVLIALKDALVATVAAKEMSAATTRTLTLRVRGLSAQDTFACSSAGILILSIRTVKSNGTYRNYRRYGRRGKRTYKEA